MLRCLLVVPLLATLAACSGDSEEADGATSPATPAATSPSAPATSEAATGPDALREAVQAYSDAFLTGDAGTAFALLSSRCQKVAGRAEFGAMVSTAAGLYGQALEISSYSEDVTDATATVTYGYDAVPALDQTDEPWINDGDGWHNDEC